MNAVTDSPVLPLLSEQRTNAPFFIVGAQRSGTTMLRLMLNRHPQLSIPFESGFILPFFRRLHQYGDLSQPGHARHLLSDISTYWPVADWGRWIKDPEAILSCPIGGYADLVHAIFQTHARAQGKTIWGDKTPGQEADLHILWKLFPGCRIIHLVRDGRDVAQSNRRVSWGIHSLPRAASDWRWKVTLGHKIGSVLGMCYREIKYEDLVQRPESTLREICSFLGVAYDGSMLAYHESARQEMPDGTLVWHGNSVRPPDPSLVYAWKRSMSRSDRIIFEQIAGDALDLLGYERERLTGTLGSRLKNLYYANVQRW